MYWEADHQMTIFKDTYGTPKGWPFPDELVQAFQGILEGKTFGLTVGAPHAIILSSPDGFYTI